MNESSQLKRTTRNRRKSEKYQAGFTAMIAVQLVEPQSYKEAITSIQSDEKGNGDW
jgi:hypothetical protein